jgi:hypothetical protein
MVGSRILPDASDDGAQSLHRLDALAAAWDCRHILARSILHMHNFTATTNSAASVVAEEAPVGCGHEVMSRGPHHTCTHPFVDMGNQNNNLLDVLSPSLSLSIYLDIACSCPNR